ncbi:hypothetical protein NE237_006691 [Protea cynaroides]|uniref:Homeobox-leucine zipper protein n=1 Tax=Protea cynaroides TaxID=273540 RepID=A0A9Q0KN03_9MAGN|nr:hypothetical protein NE237_006691 [Protea cynaroides]
MDSSRLFFDGSCNGNMLFLGNSNSIFRGPGSLLNMEETTKRRPFFSSPQELMDEEFYDDQLPEKKRRLTPDQVLLLEKSFETENKLEPERKTELAKNLGLQPRQVAVWFQNRRARWKTKQLERDYDVLKSSYDSLLSDYESILKDKEKLKAEVVSLTEKLQAKEATGPMVVGPMVELQGGASSEEGVVQIRVKVEDRLSSGSGGSAVVDVEDAGLQMVDSGDSYFPDDKYHHGCMDGGGAVDGVQSEDDDGSDNGGTYLSGVFATADHQPQEPAEPLVWVDLWCNLPLLSHVTEVGGLDELMVGSHTSAGRIMTGGPIGSSAMGFSAGGYGYVAQQLDRREQLTMNPSIRNGKALPLYGRSDLGVRGDGTGTGSICEGETRGSMLPSTAEGRHSSGLVPSPIVFLARGSRAVRGMEQQRSVSSSGDRVADVGDGKQVAEPGRLNQVLSTGKRTSELSIVADLRLGSILSKVAAGFVPMAVVSSRSHLEFLHDRNQGVLQSKNSGRVEASLSDNSGCAKKGGQSWAVNLRVLLQGLGYLSSKQSRSIASSAFD